MNIKFYNNEVRYLINTNWHQKFRLNFSINNRNMYCRNKLNPYFSLDKYKDIPNYNLLYIMAVDEDEIDDLDFGYGFNNFKNFNEKLLYLEISLQYIYSKIILKVHKSRKLSKIFKSNYCYTLIWEDENFLILSMDYSKKISLKKLRPYIFCFCSSNSIIECLNECEIGSCKLDSIKYLMNYSDIALCKVDFFGNSNFLLYTKEIENQNRLKNIFEKLTN